GVRGIPGSTIFVQHLTLWVALLGAALAARSERLLSLSTTAFLPERWQPRAKVFSAAIAAAISLCLAWASLSFVRVEQQSGAMLAAGIPVWVALSVMPLGFLLIALRHQLPGADRGADASVRLSAYLCPFGTSLSAVAEYCSAGRGRPAGHVCRHHRPRPAGRSAGRRV